MNVRCRFLQISLFVLLLGLFFSINTLTVNALDNFNCIADGDFELGTGTYVVYGGGSPTMEVTTDQAYTGTHSLSLAANGGAASQGIRYIAEYRPIRNYPVEVKGNIKGYTGQIVYINVSYGTSNYFASQQLTMNGDWQSFDINGTVPNSTEQNINIVVRYSTYSTRTYYLDNLTCNIAYDKNKSITCIGDSKTAGSDGAVTVDSPWPEILASRLPSGWVVWNRGIGADTTTGMINRYPTNVTIIGSKYVMMEGGLNDFNSSISIANIATIAQWTQDNESIFIGCEVIPNYGHWQNVTTINTWYGTYAPDYDIRMVNWYNLMLDSTHNYALNYDWTTDGTHPIQIGYYQMGNYPDLGLYDIMPENTLASNVTSGTAPLTVNFTGTSSYQSSLNLSYGDGTANNTTASAVHTFDTPGIYTVTLASTNYAGTTTDTVEITVNDAAPTANFSASSFSGIKPLTVNFTDLSTGTVDSWYWTFGDGATSTEQNPTHTYTQPGAYDVTLTVSNDGGNSTVVQTSLINVVSGTMGGTFNVSGVGAWWILIIVMLVLAFLAFIAVIAIVALRNLSTGNLNIDTNTLISAAIGLVVFVSIIIIGSFMIYLITSI